MVVNERVGKARTLYHDNEVTYVVVDSEPPVYICLYVPSSFLSLLRFSVFCTAKKNGRFICYTVGKSLIFCVCISKKIKIFNYVFN